MSKLTPKQKQFVDEYLVDLNATQAAIRAGYSSKRASELGYQLLQKTTVSEAISEAMQQREQRTEVTQDMVIKQLAKIAFHDITKFVTWDKDSGVDIKPSDEVDGTIIAEVSDDITDYGDYKRVKKKVKMPDRMKAIELLGRHLGMFKDNVNINAQLGVTILDDVDD